ncbi:hypothetical protein CS022_18835 [Veronia nyctiphanis]|uniref:YhdP central domain-containing protein n=1 Tax=Veronia nyctiphanis TaxID=1278244 RepID=A0A4Q0YPM3_9GAMM|nr:DUF3971 domain-containing protein [Veronia nyctiphanis]RXJ71934.1 hypothetical protein CS022_18835 [Veronia nyctiphanis]
MNVASLLPVSKLLPLSVDVQEAIDALSPSGKLTDLRLQYQPGEDITYSAMLNNVSFNHWSYLPKTQGLGLRLAGSGTKGVALLSMKDQKLLYGDFFQAPLRIESGDVALRWQQSNDIVQVWSDRVSVASPVMNVEGQFLLELPKEGSPWLSFYSEAELEDVSQTWRYLPKRALGSNLTEYLSKALQAGHIHKAKLVWNGALNQFPYKEHQGVFQAGVPLHEGTFQFLDTWPAVSDIDADLLFDNESLFIDANKANFARISSDKVSGRLVLDGESPLYLDIKADGKSVMPPL